MDAPFLIWLNEVFTTLKELAMAIYELRTYSAIVGKMGELTALYNNEG